MGVLVLLITLAHLSDSGDISLSLGEIIYSISNGVGQPDNLGKQYAASSRHE